ncbi:hypothetical protein [Cellulomonas sp. Root137]|uniref:hypothetical protein n=1 Tax=Cellulomonas sp. Root137 TaxID=1736459 RepID=UPI0012E3D167|nr:hypothetical protein [Cellulomonas sp. Root137]
MQSDEPGEPADAENDPADEPADSHPPRNHPATSNSSPDLTPKSVAIARNAILELAAATSGLAERTGLLDLSSVLEAWQASFAPVIQQLDPIDGMRANLQEILGQFAERHQGLHQQLWGAVEGLAAMPKIDIAWSTGVEVVVSQFAEMADAWARTASVWPSSTLEQLYPRNLQGLDVAVAGLQRLADVGITVYEVPRREIAAALLAAPDNAALRSILDSTIPQIAQDCDEALDRATGHSLGEAVPFTRQAIAAIRNGHHAAAQALLASTLDHLIQTLPQQRRATYTSHKLTQRADLLEWDLRTFMVMGPVWHAYQQFDGRAGSALIPQTFARHATAHRVSSHQFSQRNTTQALLLVTAVCLFLTDETS